MNQKDYDNLCQHGPGSPDRCGHPDCTGALWMRPAPDIFAVYDDEERMVMAGSIIWPHDFVRYGWRFWLCSHCYAPRKLHPRRTWVRRRRIGDHQFIDANAPHFKEGW